MHCPGMFFHGKYMAQVEAEAETTAEESHELSAATELIADVKPLFAA